MRKRVLMIMWHTFKEKVYQLKRIIEDKVEEVGSPVTLDQYPYFEERLQYKDQEVLIRRIKPSDIKTLVAIETLAYEGKGPWGITGFNYDTKRANTCYYLLENRSRQAIGYVGIRLDNDEAHLTQIAVIPDQQGKQWSLLLMNRAIQHALDHGAKRMVLECRVGNVKAHKLYMSYGFKLTHIIPNYYRATKEAAFFMIRYFKQPTQQLKQLVQTVPSDRLYQIMTLSFERAPWSLKDIASNRRLATSYYFGWYVDDNLVGWAGFQVLPKEAELLMIVVLPDYQQTGIGKNLLQESLKRLVAHGIVKVTLEVRKENQKAKKLYDRTGFVVTGIRENYYSKPDDDALIMVKEFKEENDTNISH